MVAKKLEEIKAIFAKRLQNARKMRGMSQGELVSRMEELEREDSTLYKAVSSTAVERYENGVMFPESDAITLAIAQALGIKPTDLLRPFKVEVDLSKFEFRKKARLGKKSTEAIKLKIQDRIEKYIEIERAMGEEQQFLLNIDFDTVCNTTDAREAAMKLRDKWNLGMGPISQPIAMLESKGAKVIEVEEDPELFDGTSNIVAGIPILVLNKNKGDDNSKHVNNEERRRFTLFHELGHMILPLSEDIKDKEKEDICNAFANEMLIPKETFIQIFGANRKMISSWELKDVQREFGISVRALMKKASELGVVSQNRYKWFNITLNKKENEKFRQQIDETATPAQYTSRYERLVYRALASEIITMSKAAELLGIPLTELHNNLNFEIANGFNS